MPRKIYLSFFLCLFGIIGYAQQFHFIPQRFSGIGYSDTIANPAKPTSYNDTLPVAVYDQWADYVSYVNGGYVGTGSNGYFQGNYTFKSIQDLVRVGIRKSTLHVNAFKYKVSLSLLRYNPSSPNLPASVTPIELILSYDPDSLKPYEDQAVYKFSGNLKFRVVLNGIYDMNASGLPAVSRANLAKNFYIESEVALERHTDYFAFAIPECSYDATKKSLHVAWECSPSPAAATCKRSSIPNGYAIESNTAYYELEWAYIDDYVSNLNGAAPVNSYKFNQNSTIPYDFRHNSTRIQTTALSYDIPVVYEHGAIVYRVRTVAPIKSTNYKDPVYLSWSLPDVGTVGAGTSCFPGQGYLITNAHAGDSLNWQYTIQFAEDGKYKHVINYFDGSLHERQTQTKINSDPNYVIATEKAYDHEGRAAIQVLPTPVLQPALGYRADLALNSATGKPYQPADLDLIKNGACFVPDTLPPLAANAAANRYYSKLNTDTFGMQKFVPDAKGYPFVHSVYTPDNTNKLVWQGGAGKELQIGKLHGVHNEYAEAVQPELDAVLGTEAGYASFYPKQVTTDANGQSTVSIVNPDGKVVLTGLVGSLNTGGPLDLLPEYNAGDTVCMNLLRGKTQNRQGGLLSASLTYYSDKTSNPSKLKYSATLPAFPVGCSKYLWTKAFYTVKVTNDCGIPLGSKTDSIGMDSVLGANVPLSVRNDSTGTSNLLFGKGRYSITKELSFSPYEVKEQVRRFVASNEPACYHDEKHFIKSAVLAAEFPCANPPYTDPCEQKRQQMMKELWPGAKYGQFLRDSKGKFDTGLANSILSRNLIANNQTPGIPGLRTAYQTGVDDYDQPLPAVGMMDPHWEYSYDNSSWAPAYTTFSHSRGGWGAHQFIDQNPNTLWITDSIRQPVDSVFFRTHVYINADNINRLTLRYGGDIGWHGLISSPILTNLYINGSAQYTNEMWYWVDGTPLSDLHYGMNEIKILLATAGRTWRNTGNTMARIALQARFFNADTGLVYKYRYQSECITFPASTWTNGKQYSNIASLSPDDFIAAFNDNIAAALLPLHPEYCKLALCNEGSFSDQLEAMITFQQGEAANRFWLDSIIARDPLYLHAAWNAKAQMKDKLSHIRNFSRIDSAAIQMAYCSGGNTEQSEHCAAYLYPSQIASISFTNNGAKQSFFSIQKQLYLANRGLIVQQILDGATNDCETCPESRMTLTGNPVFPQLFGPNGKVDTANLNLPPWIARTFDAAMDNDTTGLSNAASLSQDSLNVISGAQCLSQINEVIRGLATCSMDTISFVAGPTSHPLAIIRNFLTARCGNGNGTDFGPATIDSALHLAAASVPGFTKNDLCHAFLVKYGLYSPKTDNSDYPYTCGESAKYLGLQQFLNRSEVTSSIAAATSFSGSSPLSGFTLNSSNAYEAALAAKIGGSSFSIQGFDQTVPANTSGATKFVKLLISGNTGSVSLYLRSKARTGAPQLNGVAGIVFSDARCTGSDLNSLGSGAVAQNTALVRALAGGVPHDYYVWTKDLALMSPSASGSVAGAVTCMDLKRAMDQFYADALAYGFDVNSNHPLFRNTLANYLNFKLRKHHTYADYHDLMQGCAISDQIFTKRYLTSYQIAFNSDANASAFINSLANSGAATEPDYFVFTQSGTTYCWLNLGSVDTRDVLRAKRYIDNYSGGVVSRSYLLTGTTDQLFVPDNICSGFSAASISPSYGTLSAIGAVNVGLSGSYGGYTRYAFSPAGGSPQAYANQEQAIVTAIAQACPSAILHSVHELYRSADYSNPAKQEYLAYIYSKTAQSHDEILADITPNALTAQLSSFSGKTATYDDPLCRNSKRDLYLFQSTQSSHPGFARLVSTLGGIVQPFPDVPAWGAGNAFSIFRKANGVYWYRLFDAANNMYNMYVLPPQNGSVPLTHYELDHISIAGGSDSARYFTFYVRDFNAPSVLIPCPGYTDFPIGYSQKLGSVILLDKGGDDICIDTADCERGKLDIARTNGRQAYYAYNDSTVRTLSDSMIRFLVNHTVDTLQLCSGTQKYHYTLYYYDRAGNLEKTVPPAGVRPVTQSVDNVAGVRENADPNVNGQSMTAHKKATIYRYNSENKLIYQRNPDAGSTFFFYNALGQLAFSQTSKQRANGYYSYMIYDGQERQIESGQVQFGCVHPNPGAVDLDAALCYYPAMHGLADTTSLHPRFMQSTGRLSIFQETLLSIIRSRPRTDVVVTTYDTARRLLDTIAGQHLSRQENLRQRVSTIEYFPTIAPNYPYAWEGGIPKFTTYYSYDLDGNVSTVSYDYLPLASMGQRYKRVDYDYDLISGKVNAISANRGRPDQFYQRYEYDADNRITRAESSSDGVIWNRDARYSYYLHGPLAQVQIGDAQIQSLEYAYTINGWLKAINSDANRTDLDMGRNGVVGDSTYARDIVSHALGYFYNDYSPVGNTNFAVLPTGYALYNGNIARQVTGIAHLGTMQRDYRYDQLQRLTLAENATLDPVYLSYNSPSGIYKSSYKYDPDGNITSLTRRDGAAVEIDKFGYNYNPAGTDNRLRSVTDTITSSPAAYTDIKSGQPLDNYLYDASGNLIKDKQGHLKDITWNLAGKVSSITDSVTGKQIFYDYDGRGNRIYKEVVTAAGAPGENHQGEYYLRDASGNILSTYQASRTYKGTILAMNQAMQAADSLSYWFFLELQVAPLPGLQATIINMAVNNYPSWADSTARSASTSSFYANNPAWEASMLTGTVTWIDSLRTYESANGFAIYGNAMHSAAQAGYSAFTTWLRSTVTVCTKSELETLMTLFVIYNANGVPALWSYYGVSQTTSQLPNVKAKNFVNAVYPGSVTPFLADQIRNSVSGSPTISRNLWSAVAANNSIMASPSLRASAAWRVNLGNIVANYGNTSQLTMFYESYWKGATIWLVSNIPVKSRLEQLYTNTFFVFQSKFSYRIGDAAYASLIENVPVTVPAYQNLIAGTDAFLASHLGFADTFALREHHIYGNARIGMQTYDNTTAPMNVWRQNLGVANGGLNRKTTWYSHAYGDLIDSNARDPWGHGDVSTGLKMTRTIGLRYYELSDHLGNVLATVLDRKTGHLPNGATRYDYWKADVATAQDYYPFGMEMPGRTYTASIGLTSKFGFNGQLIGREIYNSSNAVSYAERNYNAASARWFGVDQLSEAYPDISPFSFALGNPISNKDHAGQLVVDKNNRPVYTSRGIQPFDAGDIIRWGEIREYYTNDGKPFIAVFYYKQVAKSDAIVEGGKYKGLKEGKTFSDVPKVHMQDCHGTTIMNEELIYISGEFPPESGIDNIDKVFKNVAEYQYINENPQAGDVKLFEINKLTSHSAVRNGDGTYDSKDDRNPWRRGISINDMSGDDTNKLQWGNPQSGHYRHNGNVQINIETDKGQMTEVQQQQVIKMLIE